MHSETFCKDFKICKINVILLTVAINCFFLCKSRKLRNFLLHDFFVFSFDIVLLLLHYIPLFGCLFYSNSTNEQKLVELFRKML